MPGPAPGSQPDQAGADGARLDLHPGEHLRKHVFPKQSPKVYSCAARMIVSVVVSTMQRDDAGNWSCWPGTATIARHAGVSVATVQRVMAAELVDGPRPLLARHRAKPVFRRGQQVNKGRRSYTYSYVWDPEAFAFQRNLHRAARPARLPGLPRRSNLPRRVKVGPVAPASSGPAGEPSTAVPGDTLKQIEIWRRQAAAAEG